MRQPRIRHAKPSPRILFWHHPCRFQALARWIPRNLCICHTIRPFLHQRAFLISCGAIFPTVETRNCETIFRCSTLFVLSANHAPYKVSKGEPMQFLIKTCASQQPMSTRGGYWGPESRRQLLRGHLYGIHTQNTHLTVHPGSENIKLIE